MTTLLKKSGSTSSQLLLDFRKSNDANFKLMVINHAEATNNFVGGSKFSVTGGSICR
jgi:hypothetical protein